MALINLFSGVKKTKLTKKTILLIVLTTLALAIRLVFQPEVPYGFHRDEAGIAYSAYSILKTGRDEWGRLLPLHFKALGDYPPGVYNYFTAAAMVFLGPVPLAERMPAIIIGSLLVPLIYLFVERFFNKPRLAVLSAALSVVSPWFVVQSRAGSEPIVALFFSLLGLLSFRKLIKTKNWSLLLPTALSYFLALYSYNAARAVVPLLQLLVICYYWPQLPNSKDKKMALMITVLLFVMSGLAIFATGQSAMRFRSVSLVNNISQSNFQALCDREAHHQLPILISRLFHNKPRTLFNQFLANFAQHLNYGFLFGVSGRPLRYLTPKIGQLYLIFLPFLLLGLFEQKKMSSRHKLFWLGWSAAAILPAAVTVEDLPHVKRSMYLFLPLMVLTANGILVAYDFLAKKSAVLKLAFLSLFAVAFSYCFFLFANQYLIHTKYETAVHRSYGYLQAFKNLAQLDSDYEQVNIFENNDTPHVYYLLVNRFDPHRYQQLAESNQANLFSKERKAWQIGQYHFIPGSCPSSENINPNQLYLTKAECRLELKDNINVLQIIRLPEKTPKLVIFEANDNV